MPGYRKHGRTLVKCAVKLTHDGFGAIQAETRDISETGVFVWCKNLPHSITIGDHLGAEMHTSCDDVTLTKLIVVRLTEEGVGLSYD